MMSADQNIPTLTKSQADCLIALRNLGHARSKIAAAAKLDLNRAETALRKLLLEIEKTKRRSNAIENVLIPRLQANARYIKFRFDEMERESFTKLKTVKRKLAERQAEEATTT